MFKFVEILDFDFLLHFCCVILVPLLSTAIYLLSHNLALSMNADVLKILPLRRGEGRGSCFILGLFAINGSVCFDAHFTGDTKSTYVCVICAFPTPSVRL